MALGGGTFAAQNKTLPGAYINFVSTSSASVGLSERGIVAIPMNLDWGPEAGVVTLGADEVAAKSLETLGYAYRHEKMKPLRELFNNARSAFIYRLESGGTAASNTFAQAKYPGSRGNAVHIVIEENRGSTEENPVFDVSTYFDDTLMDTQTVTDAAELEENAYVRFLADAELALTAGMPLTGGVNGAVSSTAYEAFLSKMEAYGFHALGCPSEDDEVKQLFAEYTKRMRDSVGVKFQCVMHRFSKADYEGVISVENNETPELIFWATGAAAGCEINHSLTNSAYSGSFEVDVEYTQAELEAALKSGKFIFHRVGDEVRVLDDINTLVSVSADKNEDFASNQTIRVLDQIGTDIAAIFNDRYLGKVPNDAAGRISLWNDIVKHHQSLEEMRAIEDFDPAQVTVSQGESKKSVVVSDVVTPVNAMTQLYMTVIAQ